MSTTFVTENKNKNSKNKKMDKALEDIKEFNDSMITFVDQLCQMFPEDKDLPVYFTFIETTMRVHKTKVIEVFVNLALSHYDKFKKKDESFFLEEVKYDNIVDGNQNAMGKILNFKHKSKTLTQKQKNYIFNMMEYLCFYAKLYDEEYKKII